MAEVIDMARTTIDLTQLIRASQTEGRIDVVELAKKLNLNVYAIKLPSDSSGCIKWNAQASQGCIEVNAAHPVTRQRFTIAHELAHYLKHPQVLKQKGRLDRSHTFKSDQEIKREHQADKEAAAILMPEYLVQDYCKQQAWGKKTKLTSDMISEIAATFRVSRAMTVMRLRELGFHIPYISFA